MGANIRRLLEAGLQGERAQKHGLHPEVETGHEFSGFRIKPGARIGSTGFHVERRVPGSSPDGPAVRANKSRLARSASGRLCQTASQTPRHQIHHLVDMRRAGQNGILLPREPVAQIVRSKSRERFIFIPAFGPFLGLLQ